MAQARRRARLSCSSGRPNVGKSTLFNRITGTRRSIVAPVAGTTRDVLVGARRVAGPAVHPGRHRRAVWRDDRSAPRAGGRSTASGRSSRRTWSCSWSTAARGWCRATRKSRRRLRALGRPVILAVNKTDDKQARSRAIEFFQLGFEPVVEIAAEHGDGVAELLDEIIARLPRRPRVRSPAAPTDETAVAIVGRPNVGKSSLVNRLLREERVHGQRDAGDDARHGGRAAAVAQAARSGWWIPPACAGPAASPRPGRSKR